MGLAGLADGYAVQPLDAFDGLQLLSATKVGLDLEGEDEKKTLEEFKAAMLVKAALAALTKLEKEVLCDTSEEVVAVDVGVLPLRVDNP